MGMGSGFGRDLIVAGMVLFLTGMTIATVGVPSFEETTQPSPSIPQDDADEPSTESTGDDSVRLSGGSDVDADHTMEKDERVDSVVAPDGVDEAKFEMKDRARIEGDLQLAAVRDGTKITFKDAVAVGGNASFGDVDDSDIKLEDQTEIAGTVLMGSVSDSSVVFKDSVTSHGNAHIETIGDDGEVKIDGETHIGGDVVIERIEADGEFELDSDATIAGDLLIRAVDEDSDLDIDEEAVEGEVRIDDG